MRLGSLFDGSGGFPLAGALYGIEPVWASEIEDFPIRVTRQRFPGMTHIGSVTDIKGDEIEPVDIITFGSPCQDLSIAGKQAGIHDGERSNLFFEAIRIIKEMRHATANEFPRYAVWENVPGAFSSNGGRDFHAVLQAFCSVVDDGLDVPGSADGSWQPAGCVLGDNFSLAWRVYDAQFWGVPQRRKRIYLVADFAAQRAGQILFESGSMQRNPKQGMQTEEKPAGYFVRGPEGNSWLWLNSLINIGKGCDKQTTPVCVLATSCYDAPITDGSISPTLCARAGTGGNQLPLILLEKQDNGRKQYLFRRATPIECARMQGFPDWWCDGAEGSDTAKYRMWGNGIALPCAADVLGRIVKENQSRER